MRLPNFLVAQAMDNSLRTMLQSWFNAGILQLRRITYEQAGGALLERIAESESVHAIHSLKDLKQRLGRNRFAFKCAYSLSAGTCL